MEKYGRWLLAGCLAALLVFPAVTEAEAIPPSGEATLANAEEGGPADPIDYRRSTVGGFFGYDFEVEDPFLALDARFTFDVAPNIAVSFNPAFNYFFMSEREVLFGTIDPTLLQFDLNALGHLIIDGPVEPYFGLGLAIQHARIDAEAFGEEDHDSETEPGLNVVVGTEVDIEGPIVPFAQLRVTISDIDNIDHANFLGLMGGAAVEF